MPRRPEALTARVSSPYLFPLPPVSSLPILGATPPTDGVTCGPEDLGRISELQAELTREQAGVLNGGSIGECVEYWKTFVRSGFMRNLISGGFRIPFIDRRPPRVPRQGPRQYPFSTAELDVLRPLVREYLSLGAIREWVGSPKNVFLNKIFSIAKADGVSHRLIFNAKPINRFVEAPRFTMDTVMKSMQSVHQDDLLASADLSNAYMSIPIHPDHQRFLGFQFEGKVYVFKTLPFGLNAAPWIFTKVMHECLAPLRAKGYRVFGYIDDIFIAAPAGKATSTVIDIVRHLRRCGWLINLKKSELVPQPEVLYLGFMVNAPRMMVSVPEAKLARARSIINEILTAETTTHRDFWKLLGFLQHLVMAFQCGQFVIWPLRLFQSQLAISAAVNKDSPWAKRVSIIRDVRETLVAWDVCLDKWNGRTVLPLEPTITITTDACTTVGWGGWMEFKESDKWSGICAGALYFYENNITQTRLQ